LYYLGSIDYELDSHDEELDIDLIDNHDEIIPKEFNSNYDYSTSQLGHYLAGYWEGDGHLWIPKKSHSPSGKKYTPQFCITFGETQKP
jgi:hypothetical protein